VLEDAVIDACLFGGRHHLVRRQGVQVDVRVLDREVEAGGSRGLSSGAGPDGMSCCKEAGGGGAREFPPGGRAREEGLPSGSTGPGRPDRGRPSENRTDAPGLLRDPLWTPG